MIVNNDTIEKICFIEAYGHDVAEELVTKYDYEHDLKSWELKTIKKKISLNETEFKDICNTILSAYENSETGNIIVDGLSYTIAHTVPIGFITGITSVGNLTNIKTKETKVMWKLDMLDIYYKYPYKYAKVKEDSLSDIKWKLDALHLYLTMSQAKIDAILLENESKLEEFKSKRAETIRQQKEAYAQFEKECEIIAEQNKIKERERKKALKEEAKRRLALEAKMESHEIYGEVLYKGEMFTIRSREDLEQLLQRMS